jgi:hypothetical protein
MFSHSFCYFSSFFIFTRLLYFIESSSIFISHLAAVGPHHNITYFHFISLLVFIFFLFYSVSTSSSNNFRFHHYCKWKCFSFFSFYTYIYILILISYILSRSFQFKQSASIFFPQSLVTRNYHNQRLKMPRIEQKFSKCFLKLQVFFQKKE